MNVLVLDPKTVCVEKSEKYQAEQLDKLGMEVIPVDLRDAYAFEADFIVVLLMFIEKGKSKIIFQNNKKRLILFRFIYIKIL